MSRSLAAVVLAAGQGKRMRASVPKVLVQACGRTMVEWVLEALRPLQPQATVVVYGHGGEAVRKALHGRDLAFAHQAEQRGTGHAVQCALPALEGFDGDVLVLCGDTPLLTTAVLRDLVDDHRAARRDLTVLSAELAEPGSLGRILRGSGGGLAEIKEAADATPEERAVREINTGVILADFGLLRDCLGRLTPDNTQGEYYLTDVPKLLLRDGRSVDARMTRDESSALGVNNPLELAEAVRVLRQRAVERLLVDGVRMEDPATVRIDAGVEVAPGAALLPFVHLGRDVRVGKDCRIGPFATLGPGVVVGDGATLGCHVDLRGSTVEAGASIPGPAKLQGAAVGPGAWIGPGVTTEGDGRVVIGEKARIGAGTVLRAPVTVKERAVVSAGSVLFRGQGGGPGAG